MCRLGCPGWWAWGVAVQQLYVCVPVCSCVYIVCVGRVLLAVCHTHKCFVGTWFGPIPLVCVRKHLAAVSCMQGEGGVRGWEGSPHPPGSECTCHMQAYHMYISLVCAVPHVHGPCHAPCHASGPLQVCQWHRLQGVFVAASCSVRGPALQGGLAGAPWNKLQLLLDGLLQPSRLMHHGCCSKGLYCQAVHGVSCAWVWCVLRCEPCMPHLGGWCQREATLARWRGVASL